MAENRGTDLAVGDPVRGYRRPGAKQLLGNGQPVDVGVFATAVPTRPRHADESALGEFPGERRVIRTQPGIAPRCKPLRGAPLGDQVTDLRPEFGGAQTDDVRAYVNCHRTAPASARRPALARHRTNYIATLYLKINGWASVVSSCA